MVTEAGLSRSGRCSVTLSIMLPVSPETPIDSISSGKYLEQTLKVEPGRWRGEAETSDSLVETSRGVCCLA